MTPARRRTSVTSRAAVHSSSGYYSARSPVSRAVAATRWHSASSCSVTRRPMPADAPVTNHVFNGACEASSDRAGVRRRHRRTSTRKRTERPPSRRHARTSRWTRSSQGPLNRDRWGRRRRLFAQASAARPQLKTSAKPFFPTHSTCSATWLLVRRRGMQLLRSGRQPRWGQNPAGGRPKGRLRAGHHHGCRPRRDGGGDHRARHRADRARGLRRGAQVRLPRSRRQRDRDRGALAGGRSRMPVHDSSSWFAHRLRVSLGR
jgi:hypothetical protein